MYEPLCLLLYIFKFLYFQECNDQKYPSIYARVDDYNNLHFIREKAFNENIAKPDGINGMYLQIQSIIPSIFIKTSQSKIKDCNSTNFQKIREIDVCHMPIENLTRILLTQF